MEEKKSNIIWENVIIKSFGGAPLSLFLSVLPTPDENFFKEFSNILKDFLWDTGNTKIKMETLYKDLNEGGIKLLDLKTFDTALK